MERLVAAILLKAIDDWKDPHNRSEIEDFLVSEWFEELAEILNLSPEIIRHQLQEGKCQQLNMRAAYR